MPDKTENYKVYAHINKANQKIYIGLTKQSVSRRWNNGNGYKFCPLFARAIQKYGWNNFDHLIIFDKLTKDEAAEMERALIAILDTMNPLHGYNCDAGGFGGSLSEETKEKIRQANIGKVYSDEARLKHSISSKNRDVQFTEFARQRAKEACSRQVYQFDKNKHLIKELDSISEAAKSIETSHQNIVRCCQGRSHTCCGYYWSYDATKIIEPRRNSQVIQIDMKNNSVVAVYETIYAASASTGISKGNICAVCNGRRNKAGGYKWARKGA